jgi:hypothetical protein
MRNHLVEHMFSAVASITDMAGCAGMYPVFYLVTMSRRGDSNNKRKIKLGF